MFITPITPMTQLTQITPLNQFNSVGRQAQPDARISGAELPKANSPFNEIFGTAIQNLRATEIISNNNAAPLALGEIDDLHTLGIDATRAFLAERLVVELRNRAMESYSEIMRINI